MKKFTFERACLVVFILIILISTSNITIKYYYKIKNSFYAPTVSSGPRIYLGFPTMLLNADKLFKEGDYKGAAEEYFAMTLNSALTIEQKAHAYFRLGISQYNLETYDLAADSFSKVASFSPDDSVAYNNAAVSAYRANNIKKAIELQKKALDILPAVEYYYNLARMYEDNEEYERAANYFLLVAIGEQNITEVDRIDPVRVKEKVARLLPKNQPSVSDAVNNILIALQLKDNREILTVNDNELQLKQGDFEVKVENQKTSKNIVAEYDRKKYDPYNLISELLWTVYKDGKEFYTKSGDKITAIAKDSGNYEVKLNIKYNGNKEMVATKTVRIKENQSTIDKGKVGDITVVKPPVRLSTRTYEYAIYEQLFENDFNISNNSFIDKNSVVWGKDNIEAQPVKGDTIDKIYSLVVINNSEEDAGIWANFDAFIREKAIKGKPVRISFYAKKETETAVIDFIVRLKNKDSIVNIPLNYNLKEKWEEKSINIYIPEETQGFTISINTKPGQVFKIDGFTIID